MIGDEVPRGDSIFQTRFFLDRIQPANRVSSKRLFHSAARGSGANRPRQARSSRRRPERGTVRHGRPFDRLTTARLRRGRSVRPMDLPPAMHCRPRKNRLSSGGGQTNAVHAESRQDPACCSSRLASLRHLHGTDFRLVGCRSFVQDFADASPVRPRRGLGTARPLVVPQMPRQASAALIALVIPVP